MIFVRGRCNQLFEGEGLGGQHLLECRRLEAGYRRGLFQHESGEDRFGGYVAAKHQLVGDSVPSRQASLGYQRQRDGGGALLPDRDHIEPVFHSLADGFVQALQVVGFADRVLLFQPVKAIADALADLGSARPQALRKERPSLRDPLRIASR